MLMWLTWWWVQHPPFCSDRSRCTFGSAASRTRHLRHVIFCVAAACEMHTFQLQIEVCHQKNEALEARYLRCCLFDEAPSLVAARANCNSAAHCQRTKKVANNTRTHLASPICCFLEILLGWRPLCHAVPVHVHVCLCMSCVCECLCVCVSLYLCIHEGMCAYALCVCMCAMADKK